VTTASAPTPAAASARRPPPLDGGSAAIELVLLTPVLIAVVFGLVQTALVWNAQHTVGAAAQHGARQARIAVALLPALSSAPSPEGDAQIRASTLSFLQQTGGRALANPTIVIRRNGQTVTVTVTASSVGVLPGSTVQVTGSSTTPVEGFRP
jgi:Flp pilus assembly protein TadG